MKGGKREAAEKDGNRARRRGCDGPGLGRVTARRSNPSEGFQVALLYRATRPPATHRRRSCAPPELHLSLRISAYLVLLRRRFNCVPLLHAREAI